MAIIKLIDLISCSSQAKGYGAENLMIYHLKKAWLSNLSDMSRQIEAEFQLWKASQIDFIDIGNRGSCTLEIQVSRSSNPSNYVTLLPAVTLLTLADLKRGAAKDSVFMFKEGNLVQQVAHDKWDRVKVICRQPYSRKFQFGLQFLVLRTKNDWEVPSNEENPNPFPEEKSLYSLSLKDQSAKQSDFSKKVISRGQQLVAASKAQFTSKAWENEDSFKEDVRIFFIACCNEVFKGLSPEGCMSEFEGQRQQELSSKEKLLFHNVYQEFKVFPSVVDIEMESSTTSFNMDNISFENSIVDFNSLERGSTEESVSGCETVEASAIPLGTFVSDSSRKKSPYKFKPKKTSEESKRVTLIKDFSQLQNAKSSSGKTISKFPVHSSVSSLRSQKNLASIKTVRVVIPTYHTKESTSGRSVSKSPKRNGHSPVKRRREAPSAAGSSSKKCKTLRDISVEAKDGHYRPEDFIQFDGSQPSTSKGFTLVDCPICLESFHPCAIEKHAATCGELEENGSDFEMSTDTCPFCASKVPSSEVGLHIENCYRDH